MVGARIKIQQETAVRFEKPRPDIVDEKIPIDGSPFVPLSVFRADYSVKTNAMRRDEIEFFSKIGQ